jgi:exodeoxyribonuclease VII large subunit
MPDSWFDEPAPTPAPPAPRSVLTVTQLNREARTLLERGLGSVWIEGEISNLSRPSSGHWYFSLKDEGAQVRCAMFRNRAVLLRFALANGARVLARGRVSLYEARGEFQVVVEHLEEAGEGALRRRFEELKQKLLAEGLFEAQRKRPLPTLPRRVGVITSPTGAALRDVLHILRRRFPAVPVLVYPVAVQGDSAPREIVQALALAGQRAECDVLILARGGGSLEDLVAFNDESVARAIAACPIPLISGVGHETDFTIADFVADERAPTPSGAAERAVPDAAQFQRALAALERNLEAATRRRLQSLRQMLAQHERGLARSHPGARLRQHAQRLDELEQRLQTTVRRRLESAQARVANATALLARSSPARRLELLGQRRDELQRRLPAAMRRRIDSLRQRGDYARRRLPDAMLHCLRNAQQRWERAARTLHAVSPLATLDRGYAIVTEAATGHVLTDAAAVAAGTTIDARLARGTLRASVLQATPGPAPGRSNDAEPRG